MSQSSLSAKSFSDGYHFLAEGSEMNLEDILAIQEPWVNRGAGGGAYCYRSSKYHLIHQPGSRAALYITKRWDIKDWDYRMGQDWCNIPLTGSRITVWSVYNPSPNPPFLAPPTAPPPPYLL